MAGRRPTRETLPPAQDAPMTPAKEANPADYEAPEYDLNGNPIPKDREARDRQAKVNKVKDKFDNDSEKGLA